MLSPRRGHTLPELLIGLVVIAGVLSLATIAALGQLRFFGGLADVARLRWQLGEAGAIPARVLWSIVPAGGDVVVALDTALEVHATIGAAVTCEPRVGVLTVPSPRAHGNTLAAFLEQPQPDDRAHVHFSDSTGSGWLTLRVAAPPALVPGCYGTAAPALSIPLVEPLSIPSGSTVRVTRPLRLSAYRAADGRWYLGAKDWNGTTRSFNGVQPVAGPLRAANDDRGETGFRFVYFDEAGTELTPPFDHARLARIGVVARARTEQIVRIDGLRGGNSPYSDSVVVFRAVRLP